ncbi:MAG: glycosyltransferase family 4 protein [Vicinamibacterales bacterium]
MTRLRVCAVTAGSTLPSSRFRVRQHIAPLAGLGVDVTECRPRVPQAMPTPGPLAGIRRRHLAPLTAAWLGLHVASRVPAVLGSRASDVVWLERSFVPGLDGLARLLKRPIALDVDDAIWLEGLGGRSTPALARAADLVIAGNRYLADWFSQYCPRVVVVPTAVDLARLRRPAARPRRNGVVIGWTGTSGNFPYLASIQDALATVLRDVPGSEFVVVAERAPHLPALAGRNVRFVPWSAASEVEALHAMDIGVMPLDDTPWTRGKCSFKMLQYMAAGIPSVVAPVGMNADVLSMGPCGLAAASPDQWVDALTALARDPGRREAMGAAGQAIVASRFDVPVVAARLAEVFRTLGGK